MGENNAFGRKALYPPGSSRQLPFNTRPIQHFNTPYTPYSLRTSSMSNIQRASATMYRWLKNLPSAADYWDKVRLVSCEQKVAHFEMLVEKPHCNLNGMLHGGMAATLVDIYTCVLLSTAYEKKVLFVSTELKTRFLGPAKMGDTILIEARIIHAGRTLACAEMDILDKATKKILVQGTHTALIVPDEGK